MRQITTDYLIVGAGVAGLAFADTLLDESDAHITLVDRRGKPGGHWNDAYPFVTLHQPSAYYGVNSLELGSGLKDAGGLNEGLYELASGPELCAYFDRLMKKRLLPSGRVTWRPLCNELGDNTFESLLSGERTQVTVRRKRVDAVHYGPAIPATHRPRFRVGAGVKLVPPGALPGLWQLAEADEKPVGGAAMPRRFVVVGAGKTAMDACIWLIQSGAEPGSIRWIVPRDSWLLNRVATQTAPEFFDRTVGGQADRLDAFAKATSIEDLYLRLEAHGVMLRIDRERMPTMFHFATVSPAEVEMLRGVHDVVRLGRVQAVEAGHVQLDGGRIGVEPNTLFVDCTASAVEFRPVQPIFQGDRIVLQMVRLPQPAFSAAVIGYTEAHYDDDGTRNRLCAPVPFPQTIDDYPLAMQVAMTNQYHWSQDETFNRWIRNSRLDGFGKLIAGADRNDAAKQATITRMRELAGAAMKNIPKLIAAARSAA